MPVSPLIQSALFPAGGSGSKRKRQRMGGCGCGCGNEWWPLLAGAPLDWAGLGAAALHDRTPQFSILQPVYPRPSPSTTSTIPLPTYFPFPLHLAINHNPSLVISSPVNKVEKPSPIPFPFLCIRSVALNPPPPPSVIHNPLSQNKQSPPPTASTWPGREMSVALHHCRHCDLAPLPVPGPDMPSIHCNSLPHAAPISRRRFPAD